MCLRQFIAFILDQQPRIGQAQISVVVELANSLCKCLKGVIGVTCALQDLSLQKNQSGVEVNQFKQLLKLGQSLPVVAVLSQ